VAMVPGGVSAPPMLLLGGHDQIELTRETIKKLGVQVVRVSGPTKASFPIEKILPARDLHQPGDGEDDAVPRD
jgi:hypothetical protein